MSNLGGLARTAPLIPAWGIALVALTLLGALLLASRPAIRARSAWLLPETLVVTVLAALHLLFFWQPYRSSAQVPAGGGDMASFFYPIHAFAAREIQAGRLPFWDPHLFSGAPHLANFQTGALYPPNLVAYVLARPFSYATLELLALGHFLLASYATYWLARALGSSRAGGVLAGAIYAYSGFLVAHLGHYPMLATASWAPLVLAVVVATVRRRSWIISLLGVIPLTCAVLGGHQPILLMTLTMAAIVALFELWRDFAVHCAVDGHALRWDGGWRAVVQHAAVRRLVQPTLQLGIMVVIAVGFTAPVLIPSLELTRYTVRTDLDYVSASQFSIEPIGLLHLILPTVFGSNPTDYWGPFSNTEIWGYAGVLSLLLAAGAFIAHTSRTRVFWLMVALAAVLYAVGPFASLHGWAYAFVPAYDKIRGAGRALMFFDMAVALLAGFGLDAILRHPREWTTRQRSALKWSIVGIAATLAALLMFVIPLFAVQVLGTNDPSNRPMIALDNLNLLAIWLTLGLLVAVAIWRGSLGRSALIVAVFLVVLLDVFHATSPFNATTSPILNGFQHPEAVQFLREQERRDGPFRIESTTTAWQPDLALLTGLDDIGGLFDPLAIRAYSDYRAAAIADRASPEYLSLNVRYVITEHDAVSPGVGYTRALQTADGLDIWEAPRWLPRVWIGGSDARVGIVEQSAGHVEISIPADATGRLVISQVYYPGWTVSVDGRRVEVARYDGVLQTVELPPGAQTVVLTYRPQHWTAWLTVAGLSAITWLIACGLALRQWQTRGRQRVAVATTTHSYDREHMSA